MSQDSSIYNPTVFNIDEQTQALLEHMSEGFMVLDMQLRFRYINPTTEGIIQKLHKDVLGKTIWEIFPGTINSIFGKNYQRALATQTQIEFEAFSEPLQAWLHVRVYPNNTGLWIYLQDISAQKYLEQQVDETLALLVEAAPFGFAFYDNDFRFRKVNTRLTQLNGISREAFLGKTIGEIIPELGEKVAKILRTVRETGQPAVDIELTGAAPNEPDVIRHWLGSYYPIYTQFGKQLGTGAIIVDITERKKAEEAQRASEIQLKRLMDANVIGVIMGDRTHIINANDAFLSMVGYTRTEMERRELTWKVLTAPEHTKIDRAIARILLKNGVCEPYEKEYLRKDGSAVPVLIGPTLVRQEPIQWICFVLDLSESKELERRKDDFISIASHELRTPITTLKGITQLLQRRFAKKGEQEPLVYLAKMEKQINALTRLITEFFDASKIHAGKLDLLEEALDIDAVVQESVETVQQISSTHTLTLHGAAQQQINGDRERLGQVFINLLTNAIKYSPEATNVDISISKTEEHVNISVRDYGIGIPQKHQQNIFERFYRIPNTQTTRVTGLGMGLYISFEIVKRHEGEITIASEEGKGSTFSVILPLPAAQKTA